MDELDLVFFPRLGFPRMLSDVGFPQGCCLKLVWKLLTRLRPFFDDDKKVGMTSFWRECDVGGQTQCNNYVPVLPFPVGNEKKMSKSH